MMSAGLVDRMIDEWETKHGRSTVKNTVSDPCLSSTRQSAKASSLATPPRTVPDVGLSAEDLLTTSPTLLGLTVGALLGVVAGGLGRHPLTRSGRALPRHRVARGPHGSSCSADLGAEARRAASHRSGGTSV